MKALTTHSLVTFLTSGFQQKIVKTKSENILKDEKFKLFTCDEYQVIIRLMNNVNYCLSDVLGFEINNNKTDINLFNYNLTPQSADFTYGPLKHSDIFYISPLLC